MNPNDAWRADAACVGQTDLFFAQTERRGRPTSKTTTQTNSTLQAKAICKTCPVIDPCLAAGMTEEHELYGVWGGLTPNERREMRREQARSQGLRPMREVARALGIPPRTMDLWRTEGKIPVTKIGQRFYGDPREISRIVNQRKEST